MEIHLLNATHNGLDSFGYVTGEGEDKFFRIGSASGPLTPMFVDCGPLIVGEAVKLPYNYRTNQYANDRGWLCVVKRINRKSVTVTDPSDSNDYRVDIS